MRLTCTAFKQGELIPKKYTCQGEDINPPLRFSDLPKGCVSLALLIDDPDVPTSIRADQMWDHWVVYNIPPTTIVLEEGKTPPGVQGQNTSGANRYMGPCPPDREHRYFFKLYALDTSLPLATGATKQEVIQAMKGHILGETVLMGRFAPCQ